MRLDKALCDQQVGLGGQLVDDAVCAGRQHADLDVGGRVAAVVDHDFFIVNDLLPELADKLVLGGRAMEAGRDQERNIDLRVTLAQFREHKRDNVAAGDRPRVVADDNGTGFFPCRQLAQARRVDRGRHGRLDQAIFGIRRLELTDVGFQNLRTDKVVMQRHAGISERNYNRHL